MKNGLVWIGQFISAQHIRKIMAQLARAHCQQEKLRANHKRRNLNCGNPGFLGPLWCWGLPPFLKQTYPLVWLFRFHWLVSFINIGYHFENNLLINWHYRFRTPLLIGCTGFFSLIWIMMKLKYLNINLFSSRSWKHNSMKIWKINSITNWSHCYLPKLATSERSTPGQTSNVQKLGPCPEPWRVEGFRGETQSGWGIQIIKHWI